MDRLSKGRQHYVLANVECSSGEWRKMCIRVSRGVPPELRCEPSGTPVESGGSGVRGCVLPQDLSERAEHALRQSVEESKRRGYVEIRFR